MKYKIFVIFFLSFAPLICDAEIKAVEETPKPGTGLTTNPIYCNNNNDHRIFTGIYFDNDKPAINIDVDPIFKEQTLHQKQKINGNVPVTPIYDLVVTIIPTINHYCLPEYNTDHQFVQEAEPPKAAPYFGTIELGDPNSPINVLLSTDSFERSRKNSDNRWEYEWRIKGWPNGIVNNMKMEALIKMLTDGRNPKITVSLSKSDGTKETIPSEFGMNLCAPVAGSGRDGIVTMRDDDIWRTEDLIETAMKTWSEVIAKTEPFASNQSNFSTFVDLSEHSLRNKALVLVDKTAGATTHFKDSEFPSKISSCSSQRLYIIYSRLINGAYTKKGGQNIFITANKTVRPDWVSKSSSSIRHEIGHAYASLSDEYIIDTNINSDILAKNKSIFPDNNCSASPGSDYKQGNRLYGNQYIKGCSYNVLENGNGNITELYRPTETSVMNNNFTNDKFNAISCGYIMSAIKGGDAHSYFPYCSNLPGLVDSGTTYSSLSGSDTLGKTVKSIFSSLLPETVQAKDISSNENQYLMMDSVDPDNQWGAMIEVDKNGDITNPIKPRLNTTPSPQPSPSAVPSTTKTKLLKTGLPRFLVNIVTGAEKTYKEIRSKAAEILSISTSLSTPIPSMHLDISTPAPALTTNPSPKSTPKNPTIPNPTSNPRQFIPIQTPTLTPTYSPVQINPIIKIIPTHSVTPTPTPTATPSPTTRPTIIQTPAPTPLPTTLAPTPTISNTPTPTPTQTTRVTPTPTAAFNPIVTPQATPTPVLPPTVSTNAPTNITSSSAVLNGTIVSGGGYPIVDRGFYLRTGSFFDYPNISQYSQNWPIGQFSGTINGLTCGTRYYVRAYAITSGGPLSNWWIGSDLPFTTISCPNPSPSPVASIGKNPMTSNIWDGLSALFWSFSF